MSVFNYQGGPTYRDFNNRFLNINTLQDNCNNAGVLGLLPGIIGTLQATETVKIILGYKFILSGIILKYDALKLSFEKFKIINTKFCLFQQEDLNYNKIIDSKNYSQSLIKEINVLQLHKLLYEDKSKYTLIDVRSEDEYAVFHLKHSVNIPLKELREQKSLSIGQEGKICLVYCSLDSRSICASNLLIRQGFNIIRVQGGLNAWTNIVNTNTKPLQTFG